MRQGERREAGQSAVEYALVIGLVCVAAAALLAGIAPAWLEAGLSLTDAALGIG